MDREIEKIDQEITLQLQKIDSNLIDCFNKITQDIIPNIKSYSELCEEILDSLDWLTVTFQKSSNVDFTNIQRETLPTDDMKTTIRKSPSQIGNNPTTDIDNNVETKDQSDMDASFEDNVTMPMQQNTMDNVTTTGIVLQVPDFSDEEDETDNKVISEIHQQNAKRDYNDIAPNSSVVREEKKQKASIQIQNEFASSSSFREFSPDKQSNKSPFIVDDEVDLSRDTVTPEALESSPMKRPTN